MRLLQLEKMIKKKDLPDLSNENNLRLELCNIFNEDKAEDIISLDMTPIYGYSSWFLIVTALSTVHLKKLTNDAIGLLKKQKTFLKIVPNQTDYESGWVVLDCGGFLVHIFLKEVRELYNLEDLWADTPKIAFNG
ncbi:MAG: ribosome silencing factor [Leptospirales bacterium]